MKHTLIARTVAAAQGLKHFYTGRPCKYSHDSLRFTSTGACMACNAGRSQMFSRKVTTGRFAYELHPEDHATALAYCQALDLQRGRTPQAHEPFKMPERPRGAETVALPTDIQRHRDTLLASYTPQAAAAYIPKP